MPSNLPSAFWIVGGGIFVAYLLAALASAFSILRR